MNGIIIYYLYKLVYYQVLIIILMSIKIMYSNLIK